MGDRGVETGDRDNRRRGVRAGAYATIGLKRAPAVGGNLPTTTRKDEYERKKAENH